MATFREWQAGEAERAVKRERAARELAERHGCRLLPHGKGWRVHGPQVDVLVADLQWLRDNDLMPCDRAAR